MEWNITGSVIKTLRTSDFFADHITTYRTVLASSGNDGRVRLWKQTVGGIWRSAGHVSVEQADPSLPGADVDMIENMGPE